MTNIPEVKHIIHYQPLAEPKPRALLALLELHRPKSALISCYDPEECDLLMKFLARYGYNTKAFHEENTREINAINQAITEKLPIFVICQHGFSDKISLESIKNIINYDMPERPQTYEKLLRGGEKTIVNLLSNKDSTLIGPIKNELKINFIEQPLPKDDEVISLAAKRMLENLIHEARDVEISQYEELAKEMIKSKDAHIAFSMLIKNFYLQKIQKPAFIEPPRPSRFSEQRRERPAPMARTAPPTQAPLTKKEEIREEIKAKPKIAIKDEKKEPVEAKKPKTLQAPEVKEEPKRSRATQKTAPAKPARTAPTRAKPEARPKKIETKTEIQPQDGTARIYVTLGSHDGFKDLASLAQFLSEKSKVDLGHFSGSGVIKEQNAFIDVDEEVSNQIIRAINGLTKPGKEAESNIRIICERAKQPTSKFSSSRGAPRKRPAQSRRAR